MDLENNQQSILLSKWVIQDRNKLREISRVVVNSYIKNYSTLKKPLVKTGPGRHWEGYLKQKLKGHGIERNSIVLLKSLWLEL
jgi:hypothetical protein